MNKDRIEKITPVIKDAAVVTETVAGLVGCAISLGFLQAGLLVGVPLGAISLVLAIDGMHKMGEILKKDDYYNML